MSESLDPGQDVKLASVATLLRQLREQRTDEPAPLMSVEPTDGNYAGVPYKDLDSDASREARIQQVRSQIQEWEVSSKERQNDRLFPPSSPEVFTLSPMADDVVVVAFGGGDSPTSPPPPYSIEVYEAAIERCLASMVEIEDYKDQLKVEQSAYPGLCWRQFLQFKLSQAKQARHKDFTTIRRLQNLLAGN